MIGGLFLLVNIAWPRPEIYDPAGGHWYLQYFALLFVAAAFIVGMVAYPLMKKQAAADSVITVTAASDMEALPTT